MQDNLVWMLNTRMHLFTRILLFSCKSLRASLQGNDWYYSAKGRKCWLWNMKGNERYATSISFSPKTNNKAPLSRSLLRVEAQPFFLRGLAPRYLSSTKNYLLYWHLQELILAVSICSYHFYYDKFLYNKYNSECWFVWYVCFVQF